ncbi:chaperonin containing TCP1 [Culex quinquefasciatus]|uniref:Chaperonin containing TCP1 n=1 Tax=Culex quinquefasciatus TaxID=7176 RepID=B0X944_CULQU|nr:chaperonin containing TCP1 [Culex quinquefasciatus]|eukprot:XP_001866166.1 chaperonin containing TCP1 [Culex quinquefasciatus]
MQITETFAEEEKGEIARLSSFAGAIAIGDLVKSTLGPKGMDIILIEVTIDGATILKAVGVNNPAAKILEDMSRFFDNEDGDKTTSATVLASELLREPEKLNEQMLHPQTIIAGWRASTQAARSVLIAVAQDNSKDAEKFMEEFDEHCLNDAQLVDSVPAKVVLGQAGRRCRDAVEDKIKDKVTTRTIPVRLGRCNQIWQVMIGEDTLLRVESSLRRICTVVIRGTTQQITDEADRSLHDALCMVAATVKEVRIVYGGGCPKTLMACAVFKLAAETTVCSPPSSRSATNETFFLTFPDAFASTFLHKLFKCSCAFHWNGMMEPFRVWSITTLHRVQTNFPENASRWLRVSFGYWRSRSLQVVLTAALANLFRYLTFRWKVEDDEKEGSTSFSWSSQFSGDGNRSKIPMADDRFQQNKLLD